MQQLIQKRKARTGSREEGFTIIEVLIVLAIAGLILMIVFLAVPALQRNSRNTQRKNDVQSLLGAISEYEDNNNGTLPTPSAGNTNIVGSDGTATIGGQNGSAPATAKLGYYSSGTVTVSKPNSMPGTPDTDTVYILEGWTCGSNKPTQTDASRRNVAVYYSIESGSGSVEQCAAS